MSIFNRRQTETESTEQPAPTPKPVMSHQPIGFETVVGANCTIEGKFLSNGNVRLDGVFSGTLEITGNVLVGETAKIEADIEAHNISIAGAVRGNVKGNKVQLLRTGRIWGDISATALTTEEGAFIDGKITMRGHEATRMDAEPTPEPEPIPEQEPEFVAEVPEAVEAEEEIEAAIEEVTESDDIPAADDDIADEAETDD